MPKGNPGQTRTYPKNRAKRGEGTRVMEHVNKAVFGTTDKKKISGMVEEAKAEAQQYTADQLLMAKARDSLAVFQGLFARTDDGKPAIPPDHLRHIVIPAIEDDSLGDTLIVAPPGSIKTNTMLSYLTQYLGRYPDRHTAYVCNTGPEAYKRSLAIRDTIELNPLFAAIFPEAVPNKNRGWAADGWYLKRKNHMDKNPSLAAFGVGGGLGFRLDRVILDDIADTENQKTDLQRKNLWAWLGETISTRLDPQRGRAIMIMTRWHEDDPAGWAMERGWHTIRIPALDEEGHSYWPTRFPKSWLACDNDEHDPEKQCCMKKRLGSVGFNRQYQGIVFNDETSRFRPENWRRFDTPPEEWTNGCITIDTAGWDVATKTGDYAVIAAWVTDGKDFYCLNVQRGRWLFGEVERRVRDVQDEYNLKVVVEDVPWARPLIQRLQSVTWGVVGWPVKGRSKENRVDAIASLQEFGNCWLPKQAAWVDEFVMEHAAFPDGKNDDMVDTTSMALTFLQSNSGRRRRMLDRMLPFKRNWDNLSA